MKNVLLQAAMKLNKNRKQRKAWHRVVQVMGLIVVFCTTYALILPAITMEQETVCGFEEHKHTETCYELQPLSQFDCELEDGAKVVHSHDAFCWNERGAKICLLPEIIEHSHSEECFALVPVCDHAQSRDAEPQLICAVPETEGHAHSEECTMEYGLLCTVEESDEHSHIEECYGLYEVACPAEEAEAHAHGEGCYAAEPEHVHIEACYAQQMVCTLPEVKLHSHEESCYDELDVLVCSEELVVVHAHSEECSVESDEMVEVLICEMEEHTHVEECYPLETTKEGYGYICGIGSHSHSESCFGEDGELVCTIPQHTHEIACVIKDLDLTADVETHMDWERDFDDIYLTGYWPQDVLSIAESQLGYTESQKNAELTPEGQVNGYTRYGDWYGIPYGEWCAMFASFCINYAEVENYPIESEVNRWIAALVNTEHYFTYEEYEPKPGDLIFFDYEQRNATEEEEIPVYADHVGIVEELIPATENEPAKIKTIEGNASNKVDRLIYDMDDAAIIGYGRMPAGETIILSYVGEDYKVVASFSADAGIPEDAVLLVEEIVPGSNEYSNYYNQSVEALLEQDEAETEEALGVSFARFFDVKFLVDGEAVEPTSAVNIEISYNKAVPQGEDESGVVVHFADEGIEVINPWTSGAAEDGSEVDTFEFQQNSFSVVGTLMSSYSARATGFTTATAVQPYEIDNTGNTMYVLYAQIGQDYYALDGNGDPKKITVNGNNINLGNNASDNLFWTFVDGEDDGAYTYSSIENYGTDRYLHPYNNGGTNKGTTTANPYATRLAVNGNGFKIRRVEDNGVQFVRMANANGKSEVTDRDGQATTFYAAKVATVYNVWFDGTDGGMMSYYGAANENIRVNAGADGTATVYLPETWESTHKYDYVVRGWYDIYNHKYYEVNPNDDYEPTATITGSTVFYADWVAASYDVGQQNEHAVNSLDTSDFITTYVFDYGVLFNVQSQRLRSSTISASGHSEVWEMVNNGKVDYNDANTLSFSFVDYDANGEFSYAHDRDSVNVNQGDAITGGILERVRQRSGGKSLLDLLFNPDSDVIGKNYVGTGNYLFQYMDSTTANYDGVHDGYYYLDARLNAASYNQSLQRFYLYDYLERTSDSRKDGGVGQYSDFLPFNAPYMFSADMLDNYTDSIRRPGYEYDAKDGESSFKDYNNVNDATTNYFFGIRSDIEFFLPNDAGTRDEYGNYGNISTRGEHMIFDFHGDDDVWVFIDGELVLDIGGLHGVMFGQIDFSSGQVVSGKDGGNTVTKSFQELLGHNITEGTHTMSVYYMERGSSQSNCAIYFNIAPRYDLEVMKEDIATRAQLNGTEFTIYTCEGCAKADGAGKACPEHGTAFHYAQLWDSREAHEKDMDDDGTANSHKHTFVVANGVAKCWGISAGKTYYIKETKAPDGYPDSDDLIRITLNNRGTASIETTTLHGDNGVATEGFAVIEQNVNDTLKIVALTVTNETDGDHTKFRVSKRWGAGSENMPESITVILLADGVPVNRTATLTEANGWTYTWEGLEKYRTTGGADVPIVYTVQEVLVPGYTTSYDAVEVVTERVDWIRVANMSDSNTFLLVHNGQALSYNGSFTWMNTEAAKADSNAAKAAQWDVTTDHDGFHLKNGLGYTLTFDRQGRKFYGVDNDAASLNQVIYFLNSRLVVHDNDVYYQFGTNGASVSSDGLAFTLYQKEVLTGFLTGIENTPVELDKQTHVEVTKTWTDPRGSYTGLNVTMNLLADGDPTGRKLVLNAANNWTGGFYELPYYNGEGKKIEYTVVEDEIQGYIPEYSGGTTVPGLPMTVWQSTGSFTAGELYRFTKGSYAMTASTVGNVFSVTTANSNLENTNQQWQAERRGANQIVLKNVGTGMYLGRGNNNSLSLVADANSAATVSFRNGYVSFANNAYLELGSGYAQITANTTNIVDQSVSVKTSVNAMEGTALTVNNLAAGKELPHTGGIGHFAYIFGALLIAAGAVIYVKNFGRKRKKGGA